MAMFFSIHMTTTEKTKKNVNKLYFKGKEYCLLRPAVYMIKKNASSFNRNPIIKTPRPLTRTFSEKCLVF